MSGDTRRAVAIGNFDGVHRGHLLLLDELSRQADLRGLHPAAVTFSAHPLSLIDPARAPGRLQTAGERRRRMEDLGIEVLELEFTPALRSLTAGQFMHMLAAGYGASLLMLGHDTRFGYRPSTSSPPARMASPFEEYRGYGLSEGIEVVRAPVLPGVSSSAIRRAIGDGDVQGAARMLGRPFTYKAVVMHGRRLGRTIGFPTANLDISDTTLLLPAGGVYAATATLAGGSSYAAMVNIGRRPTVDCTAAPVTMEAYLDGFRGNLYGQTVTLAFHRRLRDERCFPSLDDLKNQLSADLKALRGS